jgi:hypothetical protein
MKKIMSKLRNELSAGSVVAQICNLLYRGFATRRACEKKAASKWPSPAECNSAIQQIANLRYDAGAPRSRFQFGIWLKCSLLLASVCSLLAAGTARAEDMTAAKKILSEKQDAVIWVVGVAKMSFSVPDSQSSPANIPDEEVKVDAMATIVQTNGLAVTVLSQLDPARAMNGRSLRTSKGPVKVDAVSSLKEIKVIMADGTEIPADLVMKDADLDLGIIRIRTASKEAKGVTFPTVDLKNNATGEMLDPVVTITRMDEIFNRAVNVIPGHVNMITKTPRLFLRASGATGGCPTFNNDGKLIGITAGRLVKGHQPSAAIIPAADVLEIVEQAANAKPILPEETKPPAPKADAPVDLDK